MYVYHTYMYVACNHVVSIVLFFRYVVQHTYIRAAILADVGVTELGTDGVSLRRPFAFASHFSLRRRGC